MAVENNQFVPSNPTPLTRSDDNHPRNAMPTPSSGHAATTVDYSSNCFHAPPNTGINFTSASCANVFSSVLPPTPIAGVSSSGSGAQYFATLLPADNTANCFAIATNGSMGTTATPGTMHVVEEWTFDPSDTFFASALVNQEMGGEDYNHLW